MKLSRVCKVPCECGGWITARDAEREAAVIAHQFTERHNEWSVRNYGRARYGPPPTPAIPVPGDVSRSGPVGRLRRVEP